MGFGIEEEEMDVDSMLGSTGSIHVTLMLCYAMTSSIAGVFLAKALCKTVLLYRMVKVKMAVRVCR